MQSMLAARTRTRQRIQTRSAGNNPAVAGAGGLAARHRRRSAAVAVEGQHVVRRQVACSEKVMRSAVPGYQAAMSWCRSWPRFCWRRCCAGKLSACMVPAAAPSNTETSLPRICAVAELMTTVCALSWILETGSKAGSAGSATRHVKHVACVPSTTRASGTHSRFLRQSG